MTTGAARNTVKEYAIGQFLGSDHGLPGSQPATFEDGLSTFKVSEEHTWSPHHDSKTGFPILQNESPEKVFATGIIHAPDPKDKNLNSEVPDTDVLNIEETDTEWPEATVIHSELSAYEDPLVEELALEQTQLKRPTAMGLTASIKQFGDALVNIEIRGSRYETVTAQMSDGSINKWFRRIEITESVQIHLADIVKLPGKVHSFSLSGQLSELLELRARFRPGIGFAIDSTPLSALTVVLSHKGNGDEDVFHSSLALRIDGEAEFASPQNTLDGLASKEQHEIAFLYRHVSNRAVGHGVSVEWEDDDNKQIWTDYIPVHKQELLSTEIPGLSLSMLALSEGTAAEIQDNLRNISNKYLEWISKSTAETYEADFYEVSQELKTKCELIHNRIEIGIQELFDEKHPERLAAFRLMNQAMFLQQRNGRRKTRNWEKSPNIVFPPLHEPDESTYGTWYPFQIGFILLSLPGIVDTRHDSREIVDLIYFPTGGGKTEAYLGVASLAMFHRRLQNKNHNGVDVLMRYTLRLLTVQQFERTAGLMSAMEHLRQSESQTLGDEPFNIGVWLGSSTTKNKRQEVLAQLKQKPNNFKDSEANPFVLSKCPWCSASFGYHNESKQYLGYTSGKAGGSPTLRFVCPDRSNRCPFSRPDNPLPILITDEDIYACRPSFVLGTVDKFARLTHVPESRALFNLNQFGQLDDRLPPELIIQDELHLISGPLGSMVALYEGAIESLCSREVDGHLVLPKIVASTATTRNYQEQVRGLYARTKVSLFPQAISRANETFFSSVLRNEDGKAETGSEYVGLFPATLVSSQLATSQVAAVLSQAPNAWDGETKEIDYYSTSLWFFNSLKELGQTLTLMQSTVVALQRAMNINRQLPFGKKRYLEPIMELTGRISSGEVSQSLSRLEQTCEKKDSIHTCLASSIMEVGVDISRLGLLTVLSQPKLTAQYIQVTGRVGRDRKKGPGLIFTLFNTGRSRDRSIYERFRTFHRTLYANVEALSVTPFALQTMDKGLIGATLALYRLWAPVTQGPELILEDIWEKAVETMRQRLVSTGNAKNLDAFESILSNFQSTWEAYSPTRWVYSYGQENGNTEDMTLALLRSNPVPPLHVFGDQSFLVPNSMRTVDGQTGIRPVADPYSMMAVL